MMEFFWGGGVVFDTCGGFGGGFVGGGLSWKLSGFLEGGWVLLMNVELLSRFCFSQWCLSSEG